MTRTAGLRGFFVLWVMLSSACTDEVKKPVISTPPGQEDTSLLNTGTTQASPEGLTVAIMPDSPTVMTDLHAFVGGAGGQLGFQWKYNERILEGETGPVLSKSRFTKGAVVSVTVTIDGSAASASTKVLNSPPRVTSLPFSPQYVYRGVDMTISPVGFDPDGDFIRYRFAWMVNDTLVPETTATLHGNQFKRGDRVLPLVTPVDVDGEGEVFKGSSFVIPNAPPSFISTPAKEFQGDTYHYTAVAEDPDGDALVYSLASAPQGMTIDSKTGAIVWQINPGQAGSHTIDVVAQDGDGLRAYQKYELVVTIP